MDSTAGFLYRLDVFSKQINLVKSTFFNWRQLDHSGFDYLKEHENCLANFETRIKNVIEGFNKTFKQDNNGK